jgi:hypothetical protein
MKQTLKRNSLLICFLLPIFFTLFSQKDNFGKPNEIDFTTESLSFDTTAHAVIMSKNGNIYYDVVNGKFKIVYEIQNKIKILSDEGVSWGTVTIAYNKGEYVENIIGWSHNVENGELKSSKLTKEYIFDEEIETDSHEIKFALPNVKKGSIIEYKFRLISDVYYDMPNFYFQTSIPVLHSKLSILIPEYFEYNILLKGYEHVEKNVSQESQNLRIIYGGPAIRCQSTKHEYIAKNLPALKSEKFLWQASDYMSGVSFELKATRFPDDYYRPYTQKWEDVDKFITENTNFVRYISRTNPYTKEVLELKETIKEDDKLIEAIYELVKTKIQWDKKYRLLSDPSKAIKDGIGNNAQINSVLISALKNAGIKASPVLLRIRSEGLLPIGLPSLKNISTFIVRAQTSDGKLFYLDGSAIYGGPNMLPEELLVSQARIFDETEPNKWVNLMSLEKNQKNSLIDTQLNANGELTGTINHNYRNQFAYNARKNFSSFKDSLSYISSLESDLQVSINSYEQKNFSNNLKTNQEKIHFSTKKALINDLIYINPLIFPYIQENYFTESERKLPVEFNYPFVLQINSTLKIPEEYTIEDLPQSTRLVMGDKAITFQYLISQHDNIIQTSFRLELNQLIFANTEYKGLSDFWGEIVKTNSQLIVLKRK